VALVIATASVVEQYESFIHTHFVTDIQKLRDVDRDTIVSELREVLTRLRIVVGVHFAKDPDDAGVRIVLECRPTKDDMALIRERLDTVLARIARRPAVTTRVTSGPYR
jgi:hypothetical protein